MIPEKIYIVTDAAMPIGMAATNRILAYAKGFKINEVNCEIIIFRKTEPHQNPINKISVGKIDGIKFKYLHHSPIKSSHFIQRRLDNLIGIIRLFIFGIFEVKKKSAIIYYSSHTAPVFILKMIKGFKKILILKEESEHPSVRKQTMNFFDSIIFKYIHYHLFDGYLIMTQHLMNYFNQKYPRKPKIKIPMTVDFARFTKNNITKKKQITYIGTLNDHKDGLNILIEAFSKIAFNFPDYSLQIYGEAKNQNEFNKYKNRVLNLGIEDRVCFNGKISGVLIPEKLFQSSVLVLPRPDSQQAQNGFPTKLGEYLASHNPVIVTSVGEIPIYLEDGVSAYIASAGNIESLKEKITEVLNNPVKASLIGKNGRKVAEKYFNNISQTNKTLDFIHKF